ELKCQHLSNARTKTEKMNDRDVSPVNFSDAFQLAKMEYNSLEEHEKEDWIEERKEQVLACMSELRRYYHQDYREVYKCGVFNPNARKVIPHKKKFLENRNTLYKINPREELL
ncbi:4778_t:CDS:2, partial [Acaulospora morrowiae]